MFTFKILLVLMFIGPIQVEIPNLTKEECEQMPYVAKLGVDPDAIIVMSTECVEQGVTQYHQWDEKEKI